MFLNLQFKSLFKGFLKKKSKDFEKSLKKVLTPNAQNDILLERPRDKGKQKGH